MYDYAVTLNSCGVAVCCKCLLVHAAQLTASTTGDEFAITSYGIFLYSSPLLSVGFSANDVKPSSNGPSQRSILSLDKSDAPFSTLIDEACDFLDIQLEEDGITLLYDKNKLDIEVGSDPRVDWALRWLLKNLQTAEVRPGR